MKGQIIKTCLKPILSLFKKEKENKKNKTGKNKNSNFERSLKKYKDGNDNKNKFY